MNSGPPFKRKKLEPNENHLNMADPNRMPKYIELERDEDDGISDSDLILASQMVEAKYCSTMKDSYSTTSVINHHFLGHDDIQLELSKLKAENYQKDGEVKMLRDKLKRLELDMSKLRNERNEMQKKYQMNYDEQQKTLRKQIDAKELEVQFKNQEITELSMKYKLIETQLKRSNPNSKPVTLQNKSTSFNEEAKALMPVAKVGQILKRKMQIRSLSSDHVSNSLKEALLDYLVIKNDNKMAIDDFLKLFNYDDKLIYLMTELFQLLQNDLNDVEANKHKFNRFLTFIKQLNLSKKSKDSLENENLNIVILKLCDKFGEILIGNNGLSSTHCVILEILTNICVFIARLSNHLHTSARLWSKLTDILMNLLKSKQNSFDFMTTSLEIFNQIGHSTDSPCLFSLYFEKLIDFFDNSLLGSISLQELINFFSNFLNLLQKFMLNSSLRLTCVCVKDVLFCLLLLIDHLFTNSFLNIQILCTNNFDDDAPIARAIQMLLIRTLNIITKLNNQQSNLFDDVYFDSIVREDFRYKNFNCFTRLVESLVMQNNGHDYLNFVSIMSYFKLCNDLN